jgi:hypothetical protein
MSKPYNKNWIIDVPKLRKQIAEWFGNGGLLHKLSPNLKGEILMRVPLKDSWVSFSDQELGKGYWWKNRSFQMMVHVTPTPTDRKNSSQHRIHVECPKCNKVIPAGRLMQHINTKTCLNRSKK